MEVPEILKLDLLLSEVLPKNKRFVTSESRFLTAPGENYASLMLALDITIENENSKREKLSTVAKLLPQNSFMYKFQNLPLTVPNELGFYKTILPVLQSFNKEQGSGNTLDFFPEFYAGRLNIDPSSKELDNDSVILLENLKASGYILLDKTVGFDLEGSQLILGRVSELHASFMALRDIKPEVFQKELMPFFQEFKVFILEDEQGFMTSPVVVNSITEVIAKDEFCSKHMDRIKKTIQRNVDNLSLPKNAKIFQKDIFASISHVDLWVNNILVKTNKNKITDLKIIDWQLYEYSSVVKDIIFFVIASVELSVLEQNLDELFQSYYNDLVKNLKSLKCDISKYTFEAFQEELGRVIGEVAYFYTLQAMPSIFAVDEKVCEVHELSGQKLLDHMKVSDVCAKRIGLITRKFIEKGWI